MDPLQSAPKTPIRMCAQCPAEQQHDLATQKIEANRRNAAQIDRATDGPRGKANGQIQCRYTHGLHGRPTVVLPQ